MVEIEGVVQDQGRAFVRRQSLQNVHQRERKIRGQFGAPAGIVSQKQAGVVGQKGFRQPGADIGFAPRLGAAQSVQGEAHRDCREPGARIANFTCVDGLPAQPSFLHDILCSRPLAQHTIRDR